MASESETMLPCPFCGEAEKIAVMPVRDGMRVGCWRCGAYAGPQFHGLGGVDGTRRRAIAAWNRRAPSAEAKDAERREKILAEVSSIEDQIAAGEMCARRVFTRMRYMLRNALEGRPADICEWRDEEGVWHTSCGQVWSFTDGGPDDNHANYCHCCGKKLAIAQQGAAAAQEVGRG